VITEEYDRCFEIETSICCVTEMNYSYANENSYNTTLQVEDWNELYRERNSFFLL